MGLTSEIRKKYKKAVVTGGAGFIGSHIVDKLLDAGLEVVSIDNYVAGKKENLSSALKSKNFQQIDCDVVDLAGMKKHFKNIDVVFHNAASKKTVSLKDPRRDLDVNAKGTFNLLELARDAGVKKFVHASTGSVYGEPVIFPQDENHPLNPTSVYGVSKLAGEKYVKLFERSFGLNTTVLRYFHVFGPRQDFGDFGGVVAIFIRNMLRNEPITIYGDGTQQRSFTYVKDVVRANLIAALSNKTKGEAYNCASGIKITIGELAEMVLESFGKKKDDIVYKDWVVGDIKQFEVDNSKIKQLGMEFSVDFKERLKETINEMKIYIAASESK